ncbi:GNAT family N-acetyltransferase [Zhihengliuella sp.]|uniref:GNAT family N-acetyltransferase n=1 Tax=Zhihengliuella sp. TaxID=1954483 RepID=UPI00281196E4|nr:GNAT family N-acetyltransferase [Zhihengliuella sp.]
MGIEDAYEIRTFPASGPSGPRRDESAAWLHAVVSGFYEKPLTDAALERALASNAADGRLYTGVYPRGPVPAGAPGPDVPVATFGTLRKQLNVGSGRSVEAQLVTAVTVRASHRRQGLLRRMMVEDLRRGREDGVAVAALTASEGTIYRRFGFGVATSEREVTVDVGERFRLLHRPAGSVEAAVPAELGPIARDVFARVQSTTAGSIDRQERYYRAAAGELGEDGAEDTALRAALHYDDDGTPDGYVTYAFKGWGHEPETMEVRDLVAATPDTYLGLWGFLGSLDLVKEVRWGNAPAEDPLVWALEDPRCVRTRAEGDMLWLRILDVEAALRARRYGADGGLVLEIQDSLELAADRWRIDVSEGDAVVTPTGEEADLVLDASALASMYLGGVSPVLLARSGRVREIVPGAAERALRMFASAGPVHCLTHF